MNQQLRWPAVSVMVLSALIGGCDRRGGLADASPAPTEEARDRAARGGKAGRKAAEAETTANGPRQTQSNDRSESASHNGELAAHPVSMSAAKVDADVEADSAVSARVNRDKEMIRQRKNLTWPKAGPDAPNILIITLDTTRANHLGVYGYFRDTSPQIDTFAKECVLFKECIAPVAQTLPSHHSLFTGVYPREHGFTANMSFTEGMYVPSPHLFSLATLLRSCGYQTAAFVSAEAVKKEGGLNAGFDVWHEPAEKNAISPQTLAELFKWMDGDPSRPFFCWLHLFDPHAPYEAPEPYGSMFKTDDALEAYMKALQIPDKASKERRPELTGQVKVWDSRKSINGYDGEIRFMDFHLGTLFEKLRTKGLMDQTAILLVGDHGEGLGQHEYPEHNEIWQEQLHVPLMMRVPGQAPRTVATRVSMVDVMPTFLGLVGGVPGEEVFLQQCTGVDVLAGGSGEGASHALYAQHPRTRSGIFANSIIADGWKFIMYDPSGPEHKRKADKLFNLGDDPYELHDLAVQMPDKAAALKAELERMIREQNERARTLESGRTTGLSGLSQERKKGLEGLGYVDEEGPEDDGGHETHSVNENENE